MEKEQSSKVQIRKIAEKLGISVSTVSVVLNGRGDRVRISKETQKRVMDAAREMNYQPNIYARRLRNAANEEVPYVIAVFWRHDNLNTRLGRFIGGLWQAIEQKECKVELVIQPYRAGSFRDYRDMLSSNRFSGAIIVGLLEEEQRELEEQEISIPIVMVGRDSQRFHSVMLDSYRAGEECVSCLNMDGVRNAAFLGFSRAGRAERLMEAGFMFGCQERNVKILEEWNLKIEKSTHEIGFHSAQQLLSGMELPAAWLVADGRLCGGIMDCCRQKGIRVPQDLRLIFFEDSGVLQYNRPSLSSVDVPSSDMAKAALDILLLACNSRIDIPLRRELLPIYKVRESSGIEG